VVVSEPKVQFFDGNGLMLFDVSNQQYLVLGLKA